MAPGRVAADFNAMISADRQRRKDQALAQEIFSKGRRQSAPGAGTLNRKPGTGLSLASRVGVAKRTVSTTQKNAIARSNLKSAVKPAAGDVEKEWTHDLHELDNPSTQSPRGRKPTRTERLYASVNGSASSPSLSAQFNVLPPKSSKAISIKGLAGPYIVMAKNFAQGTTAEDIESAMTPVGGVCLSCRIVTERPTVIAEIIFESKDGADNADGNLLHVYHKVGSAAKASTTQSTTTAPVGPRADVIVIDDRSDDTRSGRGGDRYTPRNDRRRDYDTRNKVVDGSHGFEERMDTDDNYDNGGGRGLYSDNLVGSRGRDRGRGYDRGRGRR